MKFIATITWWKFHSVVDTHKSPTPYVMCCRLIPIKSIYNNHIAQWMRDRQIEIYERKKKKNKENKTMKKQVKLHARKEWKIAPICTTRLSCDVIESFQSRRQQQQFQKVKKKKNIFFNIRSLVVKRGISMEQTTTTLT